MARLVDSCPTSAWRSSAGMEARDRLDRRTIFPIACERGPVSPVRLVLQMCPLYCRTSIELTNDDCTNLINITDSHPCCVLFYSFSVSAPLGRGPVLVPARTRSSNTRSVEWPHGGLANLASDPLLQTRRRPHGRAPRLCRPRCVQHAVDVRSEAGRRVLCQHVLQERLEIQLPDGASVRGLALSNCGWKIARNGRGQRLMRGTDGGSLVLLLLNIQGKRCFSF